VRKQISIEAQQFSGLPVPLLSAAKQGLDHSVKLLHFNQ
jgi:hypothetical protein